MVFVNSKKGTDVLAKSLEKTGKVPLARGAAACARGYVASRAAHAAENAVRTRLGGRAGLPRRRVGLLVCCFAAAERCAHTCGLVRAGMKAASLHGGKTQEQVPPWGGLGRAYSDY